MGGFTVYKYTMLILFRLQQLADHIVDRFCATGLMNREYDRVKLHVTVMNTLMRKDPVGAGVVTSGGNKRPIRERESFDARNIFKVSSLYLNESNFTV